MVKGTRGLLVAALAALFLTACGGGSVGNGGNTTGNTTGGTTGGTIITPVPRLGALSNGTFSAGVLAASVAPPDQLPPGGSASISVDVFDTANQQLITDSVSITFSSRCAATGLSSIDSPVVTSSGRATAIYRALGCSGDDLITATASVGGTSLTASSIISVQAVPVSSIQFVTSTPIVIRLRGAGAPETSRVRFQVLNNAGGPVAGQSVTFSLDTTVGGISLTPSIATSDSNGFVETVVRSGTVSTSVRVTASTGLTGVPPAQSDSLVISTGLADQDSFSLSIGCFNVEGDTLDGTTTNVNIIASDRFNNPVPNGTAIAFQAEGGSIGSQCQTTDGRCSVTFTTANPRTADHRVTIRASAIGEESFSDVNGDGRYDAGEPFTDLGEAFTDYNEDGVRQSIEPFLDFNNNGSFNGGSGNFTGVLCDSGCDARTSLHVRNQIIAIQSGSTAFFDFTPAAVDLSNGPVAVRVLIGDDADQPMPGGSTIEGKTTLGTIAGDANLVQACSTLNGPFPYTFVLQPPEGLTEAKSGVFTVKLTTPSGKVSSATIGVSFTPDPVPPPPPPAALNAIRFVSASPTTIGLKGTGLNEVSELIFEVRDINNTPLAGQDVTFSLNTSVGGIELDPVSAESDASGLVKTRVRAGTAQTSVRVTATALQGTRRASTVSSELTITTGLPDQNSVTLSVATHNAEGLNLNDTVVPVTVRAADRFNNPVPDGTAFAFRTSGGAIEASCTTLNGECSVDWVSQNPKVPRAAILAYAIGEESFIDLNGDGRYDDGEPLESLGEPFLDRNLNGAYDAATEEVIDFNGDGRRNDPNSAASVDFENPTRFTGVLCDGPTRCDTAKSLYVFDTNLIIMSGSRPVIDLCPLAPNPADPDVVLEGGSFTNSTCSEAPPRPGTPTVIIDTQNTGNGGGATATFHVVIRDQNDQPMPEGTVISLVNDGGDITITPAAQFVVQDTTDGSREGNTFTWSLTDEAFIAGDQFGALTLTVTTPEGTETKYQLTLILNDVTPTP